MKYTFLFISLAVLLLGCQEEKAEPKLPEYQKWHTVELAFEGTETSETASENPFLNYRLTVDFSRGGDKYSIPGFYAADGNAADTGADSGKIWKVRFTPDREGEWSYAARLVQGDSIAFSDDAEAGKAVELTEDEGSFKVVASDKTDPDFRARGRLVASEGYFRFENSREFWLKGGTNSPENLLAYSDFDDTYRMEASARDGEAKTNDTIHSYAPHLSDWEKGNPTWGENKGKALIGAINYLASKGMRSVYFLTNNIEGDGKDVWPYANPDDFTRFDVSKLAQWEILFDHMQSKGLLLQIVLQETENEIMLDGGDTGPMRKLYFREMVARFGHHLTLNWNLGEENGPAPFSPVAQNDAQRKAMTNYLTVIDPYNHPIMLHTHAWDPPRADILDSIVGYNKLDGLSLQVGKRETAAETVETWKKKSKETGHEWVIAMDEIGEWQFGAMSDTEDADHPTLRGQVLWGTLLSGAAGVEWYFGANSAQTDLGSEDWRAREQLWDLTANAIDFFETHLPFWEMEPEHELVNAKGAYCFRKPGEVYAVYLPERDGAGQPKTGDYTLDLSEAEGNFKVEWFDPSKGGNLSTGSLATATGGDFIDLGTPPDNAGEAVQDWVVLVR